MTSKKVVVNTSKQAGMLFRIDETSNQYFTYRIHVGLIFNDAHLIGKARTLEDAIALIRSAAPGTITRLDLEPW